MKILQHPNDILIKKAEPVKKVTPELQQLAKDMVKVMRDNDGAGIAAPQIGESIRLIIVDYQGIPMAMFNPKIIKKSSANAYHEEGCLSFGLGKEKYSVKRAQEVHVKYRDINNKMQFRIFNGFTSAIVQHEVDHLEGILFTEREKK